MRWSVQITFQHSCVISPQLMCALNFKKVCLLHCLERKWRDTVSQTERPFHSMGAVLEKARLHFGVCSGHSQQTILDLSISADSHREALIRRAVQFQGVLLQHMENSVIVYCVSACEVLTSLSYNYQL